MIAIGCVIEKEGKFLLVQEAGEEGHLLWGIPAGGLELDESVIDGAKREVREESGCEVEITGIVQIGNRANDREVFVSVIFSGKIIKENIRVDHREIADANWYSFEEILLMKDKIRNPLLVINSIQNYLDNRIISLDFLQMYE